MTKQLSASQKICFELTPERALTLIEELSKQLRRHPNEPVPMKVVTDPEEAGGKAGSIYLRKGTPTQSTIPITRR